jgi:hypothetical protein
MKMKEFLEFLELLDEEEVRYNVDDDNSVTVFDDLFLGYDEVPMMPKKLTVEGALDLERAIITKLPETLLVYGYLDLSCSNISELPLNLEVDSFLDIRRTDITMLPKNLSADYLYLDAEKIQNIAYRKNCGCENRTIFAALIDDEIKIFAGCFCGTLREFEQSVDEKYSGDAAEKYKRASRECVDELRAKLNQGE